MNCSRQWRNLAAWVLLLLTAGCNLGPGEAAPISVPVLETAQPTPTLARAADVASTATPVPDSGWQEVQAGLERRLIWIFDGAGEAVEPVTIFRLDPAAHDFRVGYQPGAPQTLTEWQAATGALLVVNGGFFTEEFLATGLVVVDGEHLGASYGDFAGMFSVSADVPEVRWLGERPYRFDEPLTYALQAFPMLVKPGGQIGYPDEDGDRARRTVVAQDGDGRILFVLTPWGHFTLHGLSQWLVDSDLGLDVALNLDGGTSTGLLLVEPEELIPAFSRLPTVILVSPK